MATPHVGPFVVEETPGIKRWCQCGLTQDGPYCDDSHLGTGIEPIEVEITEKRKVAWCGCRRSGRKPFCDGSHLELP